MNLGHLILAMIFSNPHPRPQIIGIAAMGIEKTAETEFRGILTNRYIIQSSPFKSAAFASIQRDLLRCFL
jgi:hypothetical protein